MSEDEVWAFVCVFGVFVVLVLLAIWDRGEG